jgi:FkbM family methyltransferase
MERIRRLLRAWRSSKHPFRFATSRLLFHGGVSARFSMTRGGIRYRFWPSSMSMTLWADPGYAAADREVVRKVVRANDLVVDVGANIGFVALEAAAAAPQGRVIAYEPHPRTFDFLSSNVALNGFRHIELRRTAAGDREGATRITDYVADDQNRIARETEGIEVRIVRLDDDLPREPIRLLKIDVEGFEVPVLLGGRKALERTSWIYIEVAEAHQARFAHDAGEILTILTASGFELWTRTEESRFTRLVPGRGIGGCINVLGFRRADGGLAKGDTATLDELVRAGV